MEKINKQSGIAPVIILLVVLGLLGVGGGVLYVKNKNKVTMESPSPMPTASPAMLDADVKADASGTVETGTNTDGVGAADVNVNLGVKEFSMTSWYEMKDGKASTHFSLKEINVKKGDKVRIKVTNTKGSHDFNLDEYGIKKMTPLNEEVVIEFTADKVGSFKYYCSMAGHRMMGQEGTLNVTN